MEIPLFPLNTVLFPGNTIPLHIFEERYKQMIGECIAEKRPFGVVLIREGREVGGTAEPFEVGTTARIVEAQALDDGKLNITALGIQRFRVLGIRRREPYLVGDVEMLTFDEEREDEPDDARLHELAARAGALFAEYVRLNLALTHQWSRTIEMPSDPGPLADFIAHRLAVDLQAKQRLLEEQSPRHRLQTEAAVLTEAIRLLQPRVRAAQTARWAGFAVGN
jgi:Lon protease-like protein